MQMLENKQEKISDGLEKQRFHGLAEDLSIQKNATARTVSPY